MGFYNEERMACPKCGEQFFKPNLTPRPPPLQRGGGDEGQTLVLQNEGSCYGYSQQFSFTSPPPLLRGGGWGVRFGCSLFCGINGTRRKNATISRYRKNGCRRNEQRGRKKKIQPCDTRPVAESPPCPSLRHFKSVYHFSDSIASLFTMIFYNNPRFIMGTPPSVCSCYHRHWTGSVGSVAKYRAWQTTETEKKGKVIQFLLRCFLEKGSSQTVSGAARNV